jgi:hypothetical protein
MHDVHDRQPRIGSDMIDAAGFKFFPDVTAVRQLESRGIATSAVTDIVLPAEMGLVTALSVACPVPIQITSNRSLIVRLCS